MERANDRAVVEHIFQRAVRNTADSDYPYASKIVSGASSNSYRSRADPWRRFVTERTAFKDLLFLTGGYGASRHTTPTLIVSPLQTREGRSDAVGLDCRLS